MVWGSIARPSMLMLCLLLCLGFGKAAGTPPPVIDRCGSAHGKRVRASKTPAGESRGAYSLGPDAPQTQASHVLLRACAVIKLTCDRRWLLLTSSSGGANRLGAPCAPRHTPIAAAAHELAIGSSAGRPVCGWALNCCCRAAPPAAAPGPVDYAAHYAIRGAPAAQSCSSTAISTSLAAAAIPADLAPFSAALSRPLRPV